MFTIHPAALISTAVLGILLFGLGFAVSAARMKTKVLIGHPDDPDHVLSRIARAHGNTAEYAPYLALLFILHGMRGPSNLAVFLIAAATLARVLIVVGILTAESLNRPNTARFLGASSTYGCGLGLSILLLLPA